MDHYISEEYYRDRCTSNVLLRARESSSMTYAHKIGVQRIDYFPDIIWLMSVPVLSAALPVSTRKEAVLSFRDDVRTDCKPEGYVLAAF